MSVPRYFLPEHPKLKDVYSKSELRGMLQAGELSRSDMVTDDETGIHYLLGDLLAMPFREAVIVPARSTSSLQPAQPVSHEFRADTPLPRPEREGLEDELDEAEEAEEMQEDGEEDEWEDEVLEEKSAVAAAIRTAVADAHEEEEPEE